MPCFLCFTSSFQIVPCVTLVHLHLGSIGDWLPVFHSIPVAYGRVNGEPGSASEAGLCLQGPLPNSLHDEKPVRNCHTSQPDSDKAVTICGAHVAIGLHALPLTGVRSW